MSNTKIKTMAQTMNVSLTTHFEKLVQRLVDSGRYNSRSEVVRDGLRLLEEQEQVRQWKLQELRRLIQEGIDSGEAEPWDVEAFLKEAHDRYEARKQAS